MHPPPVRRQLMMYLFWLARPCSSVFGSNATTSNEIPTGGRGGGGGGLPTISKHTDWCQLDSIPRLFVREKRVEDPDSGFPPMSVIAVQCHNNLQDTHWLMCSTNGTWLIYNDLRVTTSSRKECHFNGNVPKFKNIQSAVAFTTTQNVSSASHRRMTSVILCVSFMIFFTAFSLGMKFIMGKYEAHNVLGSTQRSANNHSSETTTTNNNDERSLTGHHHPLTTLQVGPHSRWTPIDQHHHHHHLEHGMDISTVNGHLMMYRPSSAVPVHVVVTTFVNGISNPSPLMRTSSSAAVTSNGVYLSDTVPSYEEALAQEEPPPSYHDIYNEGSSKREAHRAPAPPPLYPADPTLLQLPYGLRPHIY